MRIRKRYIYLVGIAVLLASLTACKQNENAPTEEKQAAQQPPAPPMGGMPPASPAGPPNQAAGVAWTIPSGWENGPLHQMRIATYHIRAIAGDPDDAECAVYFFGTGQGGSVEANLERWAQQFTSPDGKSAAPAKMDKRVVDGMKISTMSVAGTYLGSGAMMGQQPAKKTNSRMLGAIVEAPQGLVFFKLTGPLNTVASSESDFNTMLGSVHKQ